MYKKQGNNLSLESAAFSGGRFVATTTGFEPRFHLTDHLGSVRTVVDATGEVVERSDYYPFGMRWNDAQNPISDNRYRYNGKEEQAFVSVPYTDYGARMYNPKLGRWFNVDPLAEDYFGISSYAQCAGNPIRYKDIKGESIRDVIAGVIIGAASNITGDTSLRDGYTPENASHYNNALEATDVGMVALSATLMGTGAAEAGSGIAAGLGLTATSGGAAAPLAVASGAAIAANGIAKISMGQLIMSRSFDNLKKEYNYGDKSNQKVGPKQEARKKGQEKRSTHKASEKYAKFKANELKKAKGHDAKRDAHDAKDQRGKDRTKAEIDEDYKW